MPAPFLIVRIPAGVRSKEKLLGIYAQRLRFPNYFGWNWDALEECLRDLSWLPAEQKIVVRHEEWPFSEGENRHAYLSILRSWRDSHGDRVTWEPPLPNEPT